MPSVELSTAQISYLDHPASQISSGQSQEFPIVLVHGFSSSIRDNWLNTDWIKFLNDISLRVVALDLRGHGDSQKFYSQSDYSLETMTTDVIELLDYLDIDRAHIMGYSMGSRISSLLTIKHPDRVERLILGGNGYGMVEGTGDWAPIRDGLLADCVDDIKDPRARAFRQFAERTGSDRRALAACAMGVRQKFTRQEFGEIKNQVLVAIGSQDDIAGSGDKLAQCMTNARFFPIPGRDHMRASTDKAFKNEVAQFLQS